MLATVTTRPFSTRAAASPRRPRPSALGALRSVWWIALWPARAWKARRDFAQLAVLNDRELADIGLTRLDLMAADAHPPDVDRTAILAASAEEKRRNRRHG